jgi:hypothetical protein
MELKDLELTPWNEKYKDEVEEMIVVGDPINKNTRLRLRQNGEVTASPFKRGEPVKVSGELKKRLYYRLAICYKKDWPKLKEYLDKFNEKPAVQTIAEPVPGNKKIAALEKQNADLQKQFDELKAKLENLTPAAYPNKK